MDALSVEDVFRDFKGRRAGLIKALTSGAKEFYQQCDPERENLCLYGLPNEQWEVKLPAEQVPTELPEPTLGLNFARDQMEAKQWLALVALHSDVWVSSVAFYFGGRFGFNKAERNDLFNKINELPTIFDVVTGIAEDQVKDRSKSKSNKGKNSKVQVKYEDEYEDLDKGGLGSDEEDKETFCGACGKIYITDEFWILCDVCKRWFHGECVKVTPARADYINQYKCPTCTSKKRPRSCNSP